VLCEKLLTGSNDNTVPGDHSLASWEEERSAGLQLILNTFAEGERLLAELRCVFATF